MKRLFVFLALTILPTVLLAQTDRDVLVTPDGTVYTLESTPSSDPTAPDSSRVLTFSVQDRDSMSHTVLPASTSSGTHSGPKLAYDADSKTLFALWLHAPNAMSSELLLASFQNGKWQPAVSIDNQPYHLRSSLRIGLTHRVAQVQKDGTYADVPALLLHAVWWDDSGSGQAARYALMPTDHGRIEPDAVEVHSLTDFVLPDATVSPVDANFNAEILRHPAFLDSGLADAIDVMFGDITSNTFHRATLKPIADARIHIPVGVRPGGPSFGAPHSFSVDWSGHVDVIASGGGSDRMVFANTTATAVTYIMYSGGKWSDVKSIAINEQLSIEATTSALARMVSGAQ